MKQNIIDIFNTEKELHFHYPNDRKYSTKDVIEYWPSFLNDNPELKIRDVVYYEIDKVLSCRTPKLGGFVWECPNCGYSNYHFFTCKSRFCSTCGAKYFNQRVDKAMSIMFQAKHRHITFTIAKEWEEEDLWDGKDKSIPPYGECTNCNYKKMFLLIM